MGTLSAETMEMFCDRTHNDLIGSGCYGSVFSRRDETKVVKVADDSGYVAFLEFIDSTIPSPHLPVIHNWYTDGTWAYASMEKLKPLPYAWRMDGRIHPVLQALRGEWNELVVYNSGRSTWLKGVPWWHPFITKDLLALVEELKYGFAVGGTRFDLHAGNVMLRPAEDGYPETLVIIDPLCGERSDGRNPGAGDTESPYPCANCSRDACSNCSRW